MKKNKNILLLILMSIISVAQAAMDHSGHKGMSTGNSSEASGSACVHPHMDKMKPERLATVAPGSQFSFIVFNIDNPEQVSVEVKHQPVDIETEFKDPYYIVRGKLPDTLVNTAARIDVKVNSKFHACRLQDGWLIKISGK